MAKWKPDPKGCAEAYVFGKKMIDGAMEGAEGYAISVNIIKDGKIKHVFSYENFPTDDFGKAMIALGAEAKRAELLAQTGATKS